MQARTACVLTIATVLAATAPATAVGQQADERRETAADSDGALAVASSPAQTDRASELVRRAERLVEVRRYREALAAFREALVLRRKAGADGAELRRRIASLSASLGVLQFDLRALPEDAYVEVAVGGRVVPEQSLRNGLFVVGGPQTVTARRPSCGSWSGTIDVPAGASKRLEVPDIPCRREGQPALARWAAKERRVARFNLDSAASAQAASPWLYSTRATAGRRGSRNGLLVWGGLFAGGAVGTLWWGYANAQERGPFTRARPDIGPSLMKGVGFTLAAGSLACLGIYLSTRDDDDGGGGDGFAVAPMVGSQGTGAAVSWSGRW